MTSPWGSGLVVVTALLVPWTSAAQDGGVPHPRDWSPLPAATLPAKGLPKLGQQSEGAFCRDKPDEADDGCWDAQAGDLNGDGLPDIMARWRFLGNDPELDDNTVLVFFGTDNGFKRTLKSQGIGGPLYAFGDPACLSLGQLDGPVQAPTRVFVWECKAGRYPAKPRLVRPRDGLSQRAAERARAASVQSCVECCSQFSVVTVPHACTGEPAVRGCRIAAVIREEETNETVAPMAASKANQQCSTAERRRLCATACAAVVERRHGNAGSR